MAISTATIQWFPMATDLLTDDEKVFDLMGGDLDEAAFAAFGRFVGLLMRIYREGPALRVCARKARRIARDLGMSPDELERFVWRCVESGLFHRRLWERERVLTSKGIQTRWMRAKARTKAAELPPDFRQWSLLDGDPWADGDGEDAARVVEGPACEPSAEGGFDEPSSASAAESAEVHKYSNLNNSSPDKTRLDSTKTEEDLSVCPSCQSEVFDKQGCVDDADVESMPERDVSSFVPPCMARPVDDETVFQDSRGDWHRTAYGALEQSYVDQTHRTDFGQLMAKVHGICPGGCRASPAEVQECFALVDGALGRVDPRRGSPWALVRRVLTDDRGPRHA